MMPLLFVSRCTHATTGRVLHLFCDPVRAEAVLLAREVRELLAYRAAFSLRRWNEQRAHLAGWTLTGSQLHAFREMLARIPHNELQISAYTRRLLLLREPFVLWLLGHPRNEQAARLGRWLLGEVLPLVRPQVYEWPLTFMFYFRLPMGVELPVVLHRRYIGFLPQSLSTNIFQPVWDRADFIPGLHFMQVPRQELQPFLQHLPLRWRLPDTPRSILILEPGLYHYCRRGGAPRPELLNVLESEVLPLMRRMLRLWLPGQMRPRNRAQLVAEANGQSAASAAPPPQDLVREVRNICYGMQQVYLARLEQGLHELAGWHAELEQRLDELSRILLSRPESHSKWRCLARALGVYQQDRLTPHTEFVQALVQELGQEPSMEELALIVQQKLQPGINNVQVAGQPYVVWSANVEGVQPGENDPVGQ